MEEAGPQAEGAAEDPEDAVGDVAELRRFLDRETEREFVPARPREEVPVPHDLRQPAGHRAQ